MSKPAFLQVVLGSSSVWFETIALEYIFRRNEISYTLRTVSVMAYFMNYVMFTSAYDYGTSSRKGNRQFK